MFVSVNTSKQRANLNSQMKRLEFDGQVHYLDISCRAVRHELSWGGDSLIIKRRIQYEVLLHAGKVGFMTSRK